MMSARAPVPAPRPAPVPVPAAPTQPKGKDFSAMSSRMPPMDPQTARAAKMQADARAAAGLPPLERPTATSVTTTLPSIQVPKVTRPPAPKPVVRRASGKRDPKPTPAPSVSESRVSIAPTNAAAQTVPLIGTRVQDILTSLDPSYTLDAAAEHQVLQLVDDFLDKALKQSMRVAQHRGSKTLDVPDLQYVLAKQWGIVIPGLGPPVVPASPAKKRKSASAAGSSTTKKAA